MNRLTADDLLVNRVRGLVEPIAIRDPSGKLLGHYTPGVSTEDLALIAKAKALFDLEEAKRVAATETCGFTLDEVMQHLHSLEKAE